MDAVKFLKERKRMCRSCKACEGCRISELSDVTGCINVDYEMQVEIVEKWSKEHPIKTRMLEFLKKYPYAKLTIDGFPDFLPCSLDIRLSRNCDKLTCKECREKYWGEIETNNCADIEIEGEVEEDA